MVKNILYILAIVLFMSNYLICNFFYYNSSVKDVPSWWGLKSNIYALILMLVFSASLIDSKGTLRLILNIGIGFCISNVVDKVFFNVLDFNYNDIIMIIVTVAYSVYEYLNELQNASNK